VTQDAYLRSVGYWLGDLPWSTRRDLLAELRAHLDELPPDTDLRAQLGPPEAYAKDLRAAAGLERRRGPIAFLRARRPRNLILTVVLLTVIGLAIGSVIWIDSYQPLGFGGGSQFPAGATGVLGVSGESVVFRKGKPFVLGVEVVNSGRYSVRLLGVPFTGPNPWTARLLMTRPNRRGGGAGPYERFRPFTLRPHHFVFLLLKGVYACHTGWAKGSAATYAEFPVRYGFLWRTATTSIALPEQLAFDFSREGCPPPKNPTATP
jgi:HAAS domain-containing protein